MTSRIAACIVAITLLIGFSPACSAKTKGRLSKMKSWIVYYGAKFPDQKIPKYDLYVFDGYDHPPLKPLKKSKTVGYLSFGEVAKHDPFFSEIKSKGLLIDENKNWPGSFRVDIRKKEWRDFVVTHMVPKITKQGFDGIFIDTIDTAQYLENDKKIPGSIQGAILLLKAVREHYPKLIMVLNNGLFLLDDVGNDIDALVIEDIYTLYDFKKKTYNVATTKWTTERIQPVLKFQKKFEKPILPLEYLDKNDKKAIKKIAKMAKKDDFIPYIADIHLQTIFFHP